MTFTDALDRLITYSNPNSKNPDAFFCITNNDMLKYCSAFIITWGQLCRISITYFQFQAKGKEYTIMPDSSIITEDYLKDNTWHYFTTWTDFKNACIEYNRTKGD